MRHSLNYDVKNKYWSKDKGLRSLFRFQLNVKNRLQPVPSQFTSFIQSSFHDYYYLNILGVQEDNRSGLRR